MAHHRFGPTPAGGRSGPNSGADQPRARTGQRQHRGRAACRGGGCCRARVQCVPVVARTLELRGCKRSSHGPGAASRGRPCPDEGRERAGADIRSEKPPCAAPWRSRRRRGAGRDRGPRLVGPAVAYQCGRRAGRDMSARVRHRVATGRAGAVHAGRLGAGKLAGDWRHLTRIPAGARLRRSVGVHVGREFCQTVSARPELGCPGAIGECGPDRGPACGAGCAAAPGLRQTAALDRGSAGRARRCFGLAHGGDPRPVRGAEPAHLRVRPTADHGALLRAFRGARCRDMLDPPDASGPRTGRRRTHALAGLRHGCRLSPPRLLDLRSQRPRASSGCFSRG